MRKQFAESRIHSRLLPLIKVEKSFMLSKPHFRLE